MIIHILNYLKMTKFIEDLGKTRVGVFLKNTAPTLLEIAGGLTGIRALNKLAEVIDKTDSLNPAQRANAQELIALDIQQEQERTQRHQADMASDSWLSKNIRPLTLIYLLILATSLMFWDSASETFTVADGYISLLTSLLMTVFGFYFVLRSVNQMIVNNKKK